MCQDLLALVGLKVRMPVDRSTRQHTSAYVNVRQHTSDTSAYVSMRKGMPKVRMPVDGFAYVSIRQRTSAYVSVCQVPYVSTGECWFKVSGCLVDSFTGAPLMWYADVSIRQHTSAYVSTC
jgi:hypothetical protein